MNTKTRASLVCLSTVLLWRNINYMLSFNRGVLLSPPSLKVDLFINDIINIL
jgi:hypothetical protein